MSQERDAAAVERQMMHVLEAARAALEPLARLTDTDTAGALLHKLSARASVIVRAAKREAGFDPNEGTDAQGFELMHEAIEGWSEWRAPLPGYKIACCDCGLVHEMEYKIRKQIGPEDALTGFPTQEPAEEGLRVVFRARRHYPEQPLSDCHSISKD